MPTQFREITIPSLVGTFDALSTSDSIGVGNYRLVKNASTRGPRKRCRRGGWTRFYSEISPYNNQDLHDQLLDKAVYYQDLSAFINEPGNIYGYSYAHFQPDTVFYNAYFYDYPPGTYTYFPEVVYPGYGYGTLTPIYEHPMAYTADYCGVDPLTRQGCREAITLLHEVNGSLGRRLIAATQSRIYEFNFGTGDWVLLGDGFGNAAFTTDQCTCGPVRFTAASLGDFTILTNGFNEPLIRQMGGIHEGCNRHAVFPIADLEVLNVTAAGGVVAWKGFFFLFDITLDNERRTGTLVWSDFENPLSWVPSDTSSAGSSTMAPGETILAAAELGNFLYLYTDKSIWRVTLVGGDILFSFDQLYSGTMALKFKHTLVNTGREHLYLGNDRIYVVTQFDQRPIVVDWIDKVSPVIYSGMSEDDATFDEINHTECNQPVGGFDENFHEVWFSWPTGDEVCPNMSVVLNTQYSTADLVDHGFTALESFVPDERQTVASWLVDQEICQFADLVANAIKEGEPCTSADVLFVDPPQYIWNEAEDPDLPAGPDGLCAQLQGLTEDDLCRACPGETKFVMASAADFTLKQYADDTYYRESFSTDVIVNYCGASCDGSTYTCDGYDSVLQTGGEDLRIDGEKTVKRLTYEIDPVPQTTPSNLQCFVGFGAQAKCDYWEALETVQMKCLEQRTEQQLIDDGLRADRRVHFNTFRRGKYLSWRIVVSGTGGGVCFGQQITVVRPAEFNYSR